MQYNFLLMIALFVAGIAGSAYSQAEEDYYDDYYCTTCHGVDGGGSEGVQAPRLAGMEDWYLQRQLEHFRSGIRGTHTEDFQGSEMRPMAEKLTDDSIVDLIEWIGEWEYVPANTTVSGDIAAGKTLYAACISCHGVNGEGKASIGAPALVGQNDWYLVTQLKNFKAGYRGDDPLDRFGSQMIPLASSLQDDTAIINVVSYINTLGR